VASDKKNDHVRKVLINGQIYIIRDGKAFNTLGTQIK
jgi:hypothetical protein